MLDQLTQPTEFTEEQAREFLAGLAGERPSCRDLAAKFGWGKSSVARFLSQFDGAEAGTTVGTNDCPTPHERRGMLIEGAKEFDAKVKPETAEELVDRMVAEGKVSLAAETKPAEQQFDWGHDPDVIVKTQRAIAVYSNVAGGITIRAEASEYDEDDCTISFRPERAEAVIAAIQRAVRDLGADT